MAYSELIKNFEKIREYMREFYVYGFKSRNDLAEKSLRTYDDEKRRLESYLGEQMKFTRVSKNKNVFLSIDSRLSAENPLYKAWKSKSFTDGDIMLHFAIFDILTENEKFSLTEIIEGIDERTKTKFDESTIRKKLNEYIKSGIVKGEKQGKGMVYSRSDTIEISSLKDVLDFYSAVAPVGVVGSFLKDRAEKYESKFRFKHHYITDTMDSDVLAILFDAMHKKSFVSTTNVSRNFGKSENVELVPLKIFISAQNGRQHILSYSERNKKFMALRLDRMSDVKITSVCENYDELRKILNENEKHIFGVNCRNKKLETVEFNLKISNDEQYIIRRLEREKRCGEIFKIDENTYKFKAEVFDSSELIPWIRTFISRITYLNFSNKENEKIFKNDILKLYKMYGINDRMF